MSSLLGGLGAILTPPTTTTPTTTTPTTTPATTTTPTTTTPTTTTPSTTTPTTTTPATTGGTTTNASTPTNSGSLVITLGPISVTLGTGSAGSNGSTGTQPNDGGSGGSGATPPAQNTAVPTGLAKRAYAMQPAQTVYVNLYQSSAGLGAWAPYTVAYVFADGNALLVMEPNLYVYTGNLMVGLNLRRLNETYAEGLPGPSA